MHFKPEFSFPKLTEETWRSLLHEMFEINVRAKSNFSPKWGRPREINECIKLVTNRMYSISMGLLHGTKVGFGLRSHRQLNFDLTQSSFNDLDSTRNSEPTHPFSSGEGENVVFNRDVDLGLGHQDLPTSLVIRKASPPFLQASEHIAVFTLFSRLVTWWEVCYLGCLHYCCSPLGLSNRLQAIIY